MRRSSWGRASPWPEITWIWVLTGSSPPSPGHSGPFPCHACLPGCSGASLLTAGMGLSGFGGVGGDAQPVPHLSAVPASSVLAIKKGALLALLSLGRHPRLGNLTLLRGVGAHAHFPRFFG